jgi:hypothetical protein
MEYVIGEATSLMRKIRKDPIGEEESFEVSKNMTMEERPDEIAYYLSIGGFFNRLYHACRRLYWPDEYHACFGNRTYKRNWYPQSHWRHTKENQASVSYRSYTDLHHGWNRRSVSWVSQSAMSLLFMLEANNFVAALGVGYSWALLYVWSWDLISGYYPAFTSFKARSY